MCKLFHVFGMSAVGVAFGFSCAANAATMGISVNGTCEVGNCSGPPLPFNATETLPFDFTFTLPDSDTYLIYGSFTHVNDGDGAGMYNTYAFQVTYEGNSSGGPSAADTITILRTASTEASAGLFEGYTTFIGAFSPGIAASSSASTCFGGTLACVGPAVPPGSFNQDSSLFFIGNVDGTFVDSKTFVNNFGAGSPVGSFIVWGQTTAIPAPSPSAPEPASVGLAVLGLGGVLFARRVRRARPRGELG